MLISKKVATPMSKGSKKHSHLFTNVISKNTQKSGHPYINKMLKKRLLLCKSKFSKSGHHRFYLSQRANSKAVFALAKETFDLNMWYCSDLDFTISSDRRLLPEFSAPHRVVNCNQNSFPIAGKFGLRRLCDLSQDKGQSWTGHRQQGEWQRREEEKDNPSNTREDLVLGTKEKEMNKNGKTSDTGENCLESEGSQPTGLISRHKFGWWS